MAKDIIEANENKTIKITQLVPLFYAALVFVGFVDAYLYYYQFHINILNYFTLSDILLYFLSSYNLIAAIGLSVIILMSFHYGKDARKEILAEMENTNEKILKKSKILSDEWKTVIISSIFFLVFLVFFAISIFKLLTPNEIVEPHPLVCLFLSFLLLAFLMKLFPSLRYDIYRLKYYKGKINESNRNEILTISEKRKQDDVLRKQFNDLNNESSFRRFIKDNKKIYNWFHAYVLVLFIVSILSTISAHHKKTTLEQDTFVSFNYLGEFVESSNQFIYVGSVNSAIFLWDKNSDYTHIYETINIDNLRINSLNRKTNKRVQ